MGLEFGFDVWIWMGGLDLGMYVVELGESEFRVLVPCAKKSFDTEKNVGDKIRHLKGQVMHG